MACPYFNAPLDPIDILNTLANSTRDYDVFWMLISAAAYLEGYELNDGRRQSSMASLVRRRKL